MNGSVPDDHASLNGGFGDLPTVLDGYRCVAAPRHTRIVSGSSRIPMWLKYQVLPFGSSLCEGSRPSRQWPWHQAHSSAVKAGAGVLRTGSDKPHECECGEDRNEPAHRTSPPTLTGVLSTGHGVGSAALGFRSAVTTDDCVWALEFCPELGLRQRPRLERDGEARGALAL